jgi:threonine dehydratase
MLPDVDVYGVEPEAGNDGQQSFRRGEIVEIAPPSTIADGARTLAVGKANFEIIRKRVRDIETIGDERLLYWTRFAISRTKLLIEPTGALGLAALLEGRVRPRGPVAVVISGGNADWSVLCGG